MDSVVQSKNVVISGASTFVEKNESRNVFGYCFYFENNSDEIVQLISKDWTITDEYGNSFNDTSIGFKGELPALEPGEVFEFSGELPLNSDNAVFYGNCKVAFGDEIAEVKMPTFCLNSNENNQPILN